MSAWIVRHGAASCPRLRLFAFPSAGRGPAMFHRWARLSDAAIDLCLVQLPGREARFGEPPLVDVGQVCRAIGDAIGGDLDRPFALFGHSLGALLAFEVGRHLRRTLKLVPQVLFVAAHRAPHVPSPRAPIAGLTDDEFLSVLNARVGARSPVPAAHLGAMRLMLRTTRADYRIAESYRYMEEPPLPCAISVFGGAEDRHVTYDELGEWRQHTNSTFRQRMLPGDHFFVDTSADRVIAHVLADLDDSPRSGS